MVRACRLFLLIVSTTALARAAGVDYYEMLGVSKTADSREIRKAFKKLAITMHPDKNPDDAEAGQKFLDLKTAYETLKDQESRKHYDLHGEDPVGGGSAKKGREYHNWHFYNDHFGIYDEDTDIVTLSASDFEQQVKNSYDHWFIKFYSPMCSHCHSMAPNWRSLAVELGAVVKIAAVNCEEDWVLCRKEGISSYPSLVFYPTREKYYGERTPEDMQNFVLHKLPAQPVELSTYKQFKTTMEEEALRSSPWLLVFCRDSSDTNCPSWQSRIKLAHIFDGLVSVAYVDCSSREISCTKIGYQSATVYLPPGNATLQDGGVEIHSLHYLEIASQVLDELPDAQLLDSDDLKVIGENLQEDVGPDWLVYFTQQENRSSFSSLQYRRLPAMLPHLKLGRVDCKSSAQLCSDHYVSKYPTFAAFKRGGAVEVHVGGSSVSEVVTFARHSIWAPNLETLNPSNFADRLRDGHPLLVDFYAPWCPPCMRLIPEFRRASSMVGGIVKFGSIDCSAHVDVCARHNVRSYPTLVFYNYSATAAHFYEGQLVSKDIATFVEDVLRPPVVQLGIDNFDRLVSNRAADEVWLVDFFASWCGPCIQLAPQWRSLARMLSPLRKIRVGSVDCVTQELLCTQHGVRSYPDIRLYPAGQSGHTMTYGGFQRDAHSLRTWLVRSLPSSVFALNDFNVVEVVLKSAQPWVVDYYVPWCGPCIQFDVEFELAAKQMADQRSRIKFAKVNCEQFAGACRRAAVQAYPSVRFYPGRSGWAAQDAVGVAFSGDRRKAEDVVVWLDDLLSSRQQQQASPNSGRDEL